MNKIIILEPDGYALQALEMLRGLGSLTLNDLAAPALPADIRTYSVAVIRLGYRLDRAFLDQATGLRVIVSPTTGLNHIDLKLAAERGITVLSLQGETEFLNAVTATAEHSWGLLLALVRHLPAAVADTVNGEWRRDLFKGNELSGKTIGIIGCGRLGRHVARYAEAFGLRVIVNDIRPIEGMTQLPLDALLQQADIVSVHASYHEGSHHLLGSAQFTQMKPGAVLINTARGEIVDEAAMLAALEGGTLAGAAIDVMAGENSGQADWRARAPLLAYAKTRRNLLITPHIGGATVESMAKTEIFMAGKLAAFTGQAHD